MPPKIESISRKSLDKTLLLNAAADKQRQAQWMLISRVDVLRSELEHLRPAREELARQRIAC